MSQWFVAQDTAGILDNDAPAGLSQVLQANLNDGPIRAQGEFLGPLDDNDGWLSKDVFQAERFEAVEIPDAVEIHVVDGAVVAEDVDQGKRRTGDFFLAASAQSADDPLRKSCFARAQIARQHHQCGWG